jgi:glutamate synthase domain-containing protein 3
MPDKTRTPAGVIEGYRAVEPAVTFDGETAVIDARGVYYRQLNETVRRLVDEGVKRLRIEGVNGQRYIGAGLRAPGVRIDIHGTAGNDTAMFMDGCELHVFGNAQDGVGNTMNAGTVVVHGDAGDVLGYGMRGGRVFVRGDVGYRVGIHMKAYENLVPVVVCGGKARDFFGEYMAGGMLVLLGMNTQFPEEPLVGAYCATGMHGGVIYVRGRVEPWQCGAEVGVAEADEDDLKRLAPVLEEFCAATGTDLAEAMSAGFTRIAPVSHRPYGKLYAAM